MLWSFSCVFYLTSVRVNLPIWTWSLNTKEQGWWSLYISSRLLLYSPTAAWLHKECWAATIDFLNQLMNCFIYKMSGNNLKNAQHSFVIPGGACQPTELNLKIFFLHFAVMRHHVFCVVRLPGPFLWTWYLKNALRVIFLQTAQISTLTRGWTDSIFLMEEVKSHWNLTSCECDISRMPRRSLFKFGTNVNFDLRINWLHLGGQRSL